MPKQKKLIITSGISSSGKTHLAKYLAKKEKAIYLDFDLIYNCYTSDNKTEGLMKYLLGIIQTSKNNTFILDGFIKNINLRYLTKKLNLKPKIYFCFAAPHIIKKRQDRKDKESKYENKYGENDIINAIPQLFFYSSLLDSSFTTVDTTNDRLEFIKKENWEKRWMDFLFLSELAQKDYKKYYQYQRVELPSGIIIEGFSKSEKTWERIKNLIDFENKTILDIGCCYGYFSFKIEEQNAKEITSLERCKEIINIAEKIRFLKKSKIILKEGEIENILFKKHFDIILALNMLHHVKNISKALDNIFSMGDCIIFEILLAQEKIILESGEKWGFRLSAKLNSHRPGREILVLALSKGKNEIDKNIEKKYKFTYIEYYKLMIKSKIKSFVEEFLPLSVVNFYRKLKKDS